MEGLVFAVLIICRIKYLKNGIAEINAHQEIIILWQNENIIVRETNIKFIDKDSLLEINHSNSMQGHFFLQLATR